ncbi:MAG: hypothetical protein KDD76_02450, partial [Rickettsiales bacterium]|nr:hypothetical protein [Rickettsiales bacterium]
MRLRTILSKKHHFIALTGAFLVLKHMVSDIDESIGGDKTPMFAALRYFYISCCIITVATAIFLGSYFRSHVENNIIRLIYEEQTRPLLQLFTQGIWSPNRKIIAEMPCKKGNC